ncbi:hypothetical protein QBC37DRAFT_377227 [Rhypophila decipiens]|uniref:Ysc84 actin-binding domain-containing protein n=1 Tax=Rhypophila decipiens TaxID=261697 RepID=A0AAN6Y6D1_9PEZI|nr:hypothetical protein QBC37DRAFT_377227 [Rhypophila decipiens]
MDPAAVEPSEPGEPVNPAKHHDDQATTSQDPLAQSDNMMLNNTPTSPVDSRNHPETTEPATSSTKESKITRLQKISTELLDISSEVATDIGVSGVLFSFDPLEKQCDKAARILKAFCGGNNGVFKEEKKKNKNKTKSAQQDASKIIKKAQGLLVFSTFRAGIKCLSGSSGSGVLLARLPGGAGSDNSRKWSPPVAIQVSSLARGNTLGFASCDCVVVINTQEASQHVVSKLGTAGRHTLGGETKKRTTVSLEGEQGPVIVPFWEVIHLPDFPVPPFFRKKKEEESEKFEEDITIYSSLRGIFVGIFTRSRRMKGSVITPRKKANEAFYGVDHLEVEDILLGKVPSRGPEGLWPGACEGLYMALKKAEACRECGEGTCTHAETGQSDLPPSPAGVTPTTACSAPYATPVFAAVD